MRVFCSDDADFLTVFSIDSLYAPCYTETTHWGWGVGGCYE